MLLLLQDLELALCFAFSGAKQLSGEAIPGRQIRLTGLCKKLGQTSLPALEQAGQFTPLSLGHFVQHVRELVGQDRAFSIRGLYLPECEHCLQMVLAFRGERIGLPA